MYPAVARQMAQEDYVTDKKKSKLDKTLLICKIVFLVSVSVSILSLFVTAGVAV